jgi:hypothetical protein
MPDEERPKLQVVAQNSQVAVDAEYAQQAIDRALLQLTANLIRIVRGAGKPEELIGQCAEFVNAAVDFQDKTKRWPPPNALVEAVRFEQDRSTDYDSFEARRQMAINTMIRGSLQMVASKLLEQRTQFDRGEDEFDRGYRILEDLFEEQRKKRIAEQRAARQPSATKRKPPKRPKTKSKI